MRQLVASHVGVPLADVEMMEGRLSGSDFSLNATQSLGDEGREWIEALEDDAPQAEDRVAQDHDQAALKSWLDEALAALSARERFIVTARKLNEETRTLESLGEELGLSKERVRQLEAAAFGKMRRWLESEKREVALLLA
jgi:RNA polymerase sigma-32 factor